MIVDPHPELAVWLDGEFLPWREARLPLTAHHYGVGVFEGLRAYQGDRGTAIFRLRDHTARLFRSSQILGIPIPAAFGPERLDEVQREIIARNGLGNAYLRPFVFYDGASGIGLHTGSLSIRVAIVALPWSDDGAHLDPEGKKHGIRLRTSSYRRHHPGSLLSKAKANGNYMTSILALAEARSGGAHDALLLDHDGFVTEATGANVFCVRDGALYTPPPEAILEGITRRTIIELAEEMGVPVFEKRLARDDLYTSEEVFLTGTAAEVTPVREIDGRTIGGAALPASLTAKFQESYGAHVRGRAGFNRGWLTPVQKNS